MPKTKEEMPDSKIRSLRHKVVNGIPKPAKWFVGGVAGLALICEPPKGEANIGPRYWVLFYSINGKREEKFLGSYPSISSANAKVLSRDVRLQLAQGDDPRELDRQQAKEIKIREGLLTPFKVASKKWHDVQIARPNVSTQDYQKRYRAIKKYITPILGDMPISEIETKEVLHALETIWRKMPPTAWKIRGALKQIFDRAEVDGIYDGKNPARWGNHLELLLPHPDSFHKTKNQPSLHYNDVPEFFNKLMQLETVGAKALMLHILTVGRTETNCQAEWEQFDFQKKIWQRPAEIMKSVNGKKLPHTQPISDSTVKFLESIRGKTLKKGSISSEGRIFNAPKGGKIYNPELQKIIPELGYSTEDVVPHGFRASFKDWSLDETNYGELVIEKCMAHNVGDESRNAYVRTEFIERRRPAIEERAKWCFEGEPVKAAKVIPIGKGGKK
jgi:integrase